MSTRHFIGIDAGNSTAKVAAMTDGVALVSQAIVPNVSALAEELSIPPSSADPLKRLDMEIMNAEKGYEGEYFVGHLAAKQLAREVEQDRSRDKANSDNINLITPAILAALCHSGDRVALGVGVPFTDFQSQRAKIIERLQRPFQVRFGPYSDRPGQVVDFEVDRVYPYPQTAAGYLAQALGQTGKEHPEWASSCILVLDLGLGQTGLGYVESGEPAKAGCFSVDEAFLRVATAVQRYLNAEHQKDLTIPEILDVIEIGKYPHGTDPIDLTAIIYSGCEQLVRAIKKRFDDLVSQKMRDQVSAILLLGGGSLAPGMDQVISEEFRLPAVVGENPRFANAMGLMIQAKAKYTKELVAGNVAR